ncbi:hypothetical protein IQ259_00580 [Fortiea sp. LEGE XX443]|uniref:hypothetical protein n=1 Tax=Fortiea sp. LEGE XX443 TaxID=1828611 RepID=UPI001880AB43|nr:hypothetical protein [Fortiea sp. LEGE XX443]MBE9003563.1 hypothetical protein [Fortiea sp. LEGE XX443]
MTTKQNNTSFKFTFTQLLIAVIVIGIIWIVVSSSFIFKNILNKSGSIEKTMEAARAVLLETQKKASTEGRSYTLQFRNSAEGVEYLTAQTSSQSEWQKLSNDTAIVVQESKILFDSKGNLKSLTSPLTFDYKSQRKCWIIDSNLKNIREEEGGDCK